MVKVNCAFNGKRKMLRKTLQHICSSLEIEEALVSAGLPSMVLLMQFLIYPVNETPVTGLSKSVLLAFVFSLLFFFSVKARGACT